MLTGLKHAGRMMVPGPPDIHGTSRSPDVRALGNFKAELNSQLCWCLVISRPEAKRNEGFTEVVWTYDCFTNRRPLKRLSILIKRTLWIHCTDSLFLPEYRRRRLTLVHRQKQSMAGVIELLPYENVRSCTPPQGLRKDVDLEFSYDAPRSPAIPPVAVTPKTTPNRSNPRHLWPEYSTPSPDSVRFLRSNASFHQTHRTTRPVSGLSAAPCQRSQHTQPGMMFGEKHTNFRMIEYTSLWRHLHYASSSLFLRD